MSTNFKSLARRTARDFQRDNALQLAAAVAFYAALSLAPLLMLLLWIVGLLDPGLQDQVVQRVSTVVGDAGRDTVRTIVEQADQSVNTGSWAGAIGIATLLFAATGVFAQLQRALNLIWNVEPRRGQGIGGFLRKRLLSLLMILIIGALLLASVAITTAMSAVSQPLVGDSAAGNWLGPLLNVLVSLVVFTALFAAIFKLLPDVRIAWRDVWYGAILTAILFTIGKWLIGLYLGHTSVGSAYGAAGSLVALLVWVYYSAIIFFAGAEWTQAWVRTQGRTLQPDKHAQWRRLDSEPSPATA